MAKASTNAIPINMVVNNLPLISGCRAVPSKAALAIPPIALLAPKTPIAIQNAAPIAKKALSREKFTPAAPAAAATVDASSVAAIATFKIGKNIRYNAKCKNQNVN